MNNSIIYGKISKEIIFKNERAILNVADEKTLTDGTVKKNNWLIVAFKSLAERCNACLTIGSSVVVSGSFETRSYKDEYGIDRWTTELYAKEVIMVNADDLEKEKKYFESLEYIKSHEKFIPNAKETEQLTKVDQIKDENDINTDY